MEVDDHKVIEEVGLRGLAHWVWRTLRSLLQERPAIIISSAFILIMLWGYHGEVEILARLAGDGISHGYLGPAKGWVGDAMRLAPPAREPLIPGIPWDQELISFLIGLVLVVGVPMLIIRYGFRQKLSDFGLGLPRAGDRAAGWLGCLALIAICVVPFYVGTFNSGPNSMQQVYPLYRPFSGVGAFVAYELCYLPFFIAIEFIFRGYLLQGLRYIPDPLGTGDAGVTGRLFFGDYALLIQMLSYTAWHLGKPLPELWGTPVWGLIAGAVALRSRSIWPVTVAHYLLNVFMDATILHRLGIWPG